MFNPNRLLIARKRRKFTGKELAETIGVTAQTITRLEKKGANPEESTVDALSEVLDFPKAFFYGHHIDPPTKESASFRSLSSMSAKERDAALVAGALAYLVSDWIDENFNLPKIDLLDFSHERKPEIAARMLRQHWGLGERPVSNTIKLLESKGVRVFSLVENTRNVDAFSCWRNNTPFVFLNTYKTAEHSRFDALHELGHLVLHRHGESKGREAEQEANEFASFFLMPTADLISHVPMVASVNRLIQLKKRWGVSVLALTYRLHKAKYISDWQYRSFCIQINKRFGKAEPDGLEPEKSVVLEQVFRELWKSGDTREDLGKELFLPVAEIDNLLFGLLGDKSNIRDQSEEKGSPRLQVVDSS